MNEKGNSNTKKTTIIVEKKDKTNSNKMENRLEAFGVMIDWWLNETSIDYLIDSAYIGEYKQKVCDYYKQVIDTNIERIGIDAETDIRIYRKAQNLALKHLINFKPPIMPLVQTAKERRVRQQQVLYINKKLMDFRRQGNIQNDPDTRINLTDKTF